jgi:hypothetical protein
MVMGLYTFARFRPPVWVWLLVLSVRDATFATPRPNGRRRRILAVLPSVLTRPARGSDAIVDAFDLGAPTASTGNAGAHPSLSLGGQRPSRGAQWTSRRNGRGVESPKTGRRVNGLQQRVGKPRVIVLQDGQAGSQVAARCVSVSGGDLLGTRWRRRWRDCRWSHAVCKEQRAVEAGPDARATGAVQLKQAGSRRTRALLDRQSQP